MKFNTTLTEKTIVNKAGGLSYSQTPELELVSILLTSFANDQFYRGENETFQRLKELISICNKEFVAKAAVYARTKFGMRSISHVAASELAKHIKGEKWAKSFYDAVVYRPDDMLEILSYHKANNGKITNAMKKGFAKAFDDFNKYEIAKYRGEGKGFKLVDVVNIVHPVPNEMNSEAIAALTKGKLRSFDTWEQELSRAGQLASSDEEKADFKKDVWVRLIKEKKIGYFALLRNLRNIITQAPEVLTEALEMLTNEAVIKKSLVLPFRFLTAYEEIKKITNEGKAVRLALSALNKAVDISLNNIPCFDGDTLVVLDTSGSMRDDYNTKGAKTPFIIGRLFAVALAKSNNCDLMTFDYNARYVNFDISDSTITLATSIEFEGGSTNFHSIFQTANKKYDRIIILSDMQGWVNGWHTPAGEFHDYERKFKAKPFVYSFDLNSYGSMQIREDRVYCIAGFSEKVFDIMKLIEADKQALINEIKKIEL